MKNVLTPARGAILGALIVGAGMPAEAQLRSALDAGERATRSASQTQAQINQLDDERSDLVREFRTVVQRKDAAELNVRQLTQIVDSQSRELASLEDQLSRIDEITSVMVPMMIDMIDDLETFVEADLPFELDDRRARIARLRSTLSEPNVVPAEKYRIIIEAYQTEMESGNTVQTWSSTVPINDKPTDVDMFRYGRVSLVYVTPDNRYGARWDRETEMWVEVDAAYRQQIRTAIRTAEELIQPEILFAPISKLTIPQAATVEPVELAPEVDAYRSVLAQTENLAIFSAQQEETLKKQENEIAQLEEFIAAREELGLEVRPLIENMVEELTAFVAADLPYHEEDRQGRMDTLSRALEEETSVSNLLSVVLSAYRLELEEGNKVEVWNDQIDADGSGELKEVRLYRLGRTAMVYLSLDKTKAGRFERSTRTWVPVSATQRNDIIKAIKIADNVAQKNVIFAPITKYSTQAQ